MRFSALRLLIAVLASAVVGSGVASCAGAATGGARPLVVRQDQRVLGRFTLPQLRNLPQVQIATPQSRGAQVQQGPTVRSVLRAANAAGVDRVRVEGRDPAQTLTDAELTEQVILNVTKRNTLKLTGTQLGRDRWVRDVTALVVNP
ncbi:hypothetical protein BST11_18470 [Mycobacterium alsense]|uniref:Uncharacterized protein n=1 Tax=Mycobacterium alsense TaxID=324058 RepID=A0AA41XLC2_9MYCO|nr:hypothetical protein [Mycobacterium alsense]MCV7378306.1 hypothetical protein [Mycobacterium alsense]OQZ89273.1 hypothetical protein BST11_18470 [Mycobacterium alsense]